MEPSVSPPGASKQAGARRPCTGSSVKDLCIVSKQGSIAEVESALAKNGGSIDGRNAFGLGALHLATWRNHLPIVRRLLDAGANPDARDGESGWSSLHRALHFGHLCIAGVLLQFGASLNLEDTKGRTPIDLLSGPVSQANGDSPNSVATEVFSWGSGTNYQLGTGNAHIQKLPCKVDALHGSYIKTVAASKFHSVAVSSDGELYTWGFGRGGRLGHPDIQSGQTTAVITPRQVTVGLGRKKVNVVAAAKHHTVIATSAGELFTWGSNREGQLGYPSVDTQPTPRRVSSLKQRIIAVAAANKHSAAVADTGEVFTWGSNKEGQLGYGTSNSASNCIPRMVEYLKGKVFKGVSAAKYHTLVFGADGEVFTWGHRLVTPRRVVIARCLKKGGNANVKFHRMERLQVISVAAGVMHSTALTADGALFNWNSSDLDLRCQQVFSMCGRNVVSISAGKYWTALATSTGDVFMCDAKKRKDETPVFTRVNGVKRASSVCVGETHMLVLSSIYHPEYPSKPKIQSKKPLSEWSGVMEELDEDILFNDVQPETDLSVINSEMSKGIPSLKSLCEKVAVQHIMEPKNAIQLLEVADSLEAKELKKHCEDTAIRNLDYIFTVAAPSIMNASPEILANLERLLDGKSSEPWSHRRLPTMTATYPAVIDSDAEGDDAGGFPRLRDSQKPASKLYGMSGYGNFLQKESNAEQAVSKQIRAIRKKLQQIEMLEAKQLDGHQLDDQQLAKLESRAALESELAELGFPTEAFSRPSVYVPNKKSEGSKKQKKKIKQAAQSDITSIKHEDKEQNHIKELPEVLPTHGSSEKEPVKPSDDGTSSYTKAIFCPLGDKAPRPNSSKKKNKKGGLSLFLSGALDDTPKLSLPTPVLPVTPKQEGPAWGGAKITKGPASLRDIQSEQRSKMNELMTTKAKDRHEDSPDSAGLLRLSSFMPDACSSPISVTPARAVPVHEGDKSTPPWSSSATSPNLSRPSLRDIQMQQEKRHHGAVSHSPKTRTSGFAIPSLGAAPEVVGVKDNVPNRWFKPETDKYPNHSLGDKTRDSSASSPPPMELLSGPALAWRQYRSLLRKNATLAWRHRRSSALQLLSSLIFIFLIFCIDRAVRSRFSYTTAYQNVRDPKALVAPPIPPCEDKFFVKTPCYDFLWSSGGSARVPALVDAIRRNNPGRPIPAEKVLGFRTPDDVDAWLFENPMRCPGALHFQDINATQMSYGIQTNSTPVARRGTYEDPTFKFQIPLQVAAEREMARLIIGDPNFSWTVGFKEFAHPATETFSTIAQAGPTFFLAIAMFGFVFQISALVTEKELKLRQAMSIMGLYESAYWLSWLTWEALLTLISALFTVLFGMMFQFDFFLNNSFGILFFLFFLFQLNMLGFAFMISTFVAKAASATTVGFAIFIIGFLTQLVTTFGFPYSNTYEAYYRTIWSFFPPNVFAQGLNILGKATATPEDKGISWNQRTTCQSFETDCVITVDDIYIWLISTFFLWFILAIYFDNIIPNVNGVRKSVLYFLTPSYWTGKGGGKMREGGLCRCFGSNHSADDASPTDEDVLTEENLVKEQAAGNEVDPGVAVQIRGLRKTYPGSFNMGCCKCRTTKPFHSVKGLWVNLEKDQLFCLLGPNGAGKTTTISCLTGITPITGGDALIYGHSVRSSAGMSNIRRMIGVCPQFDILWDALTAKEHMELFASIKGLPPSTIKSVAEQSLAQVKLSQAANVRAGSYSGGMKRRLSVAIALIGDPKLVFLDEPTTGMDPITRRHVWDIIEEAKKGRAIVLTTHSMEEADILSDRIAIMAKGKLRCIGTSIRLKSKFGTGYIANVNFSGNGHAQSPNINGDTEAPVNPNIESVKSFFKERLDVDPKEESRTFLTFVIPHEKEPLLTRFFGELEDREREFGISDIQLGLTTLEEVFLNIAKQAELESSTAEGTLVTLNLSSGATIQIPKGARFVGIPGTDTEEHPRGVMVEVFWDQDDNGTLCVSGHSDETPVPANVELTRPPSLSRRASVGRGGPVGYVIDADQVPTTR